jgi:hypothetical protein
MIGDPARAASLRFEESRRAKRGFIRKILLWI